MGTTIRAADVTQPMDAALLSERIAQADVIIRAEVESVAQVVDSFSIKYHGGYRPAVYSKALEYTLTVHEYLKGSGGYEVVAVVIDHFLNYPTEAEAEAATTDHLSARDTQWEDREGIFFLMDWRSEGSPASTNQTDRYMMGAVRSGMGDYDYYTIASRYSKRWLPAIEADADDGTTPARTYFLDVPTPTGAGPTITLTALKAEITDIAVEVALGNGTNAYRNCVVAKYAQQRRYDHRAASSAAVPQPGFAIGSGLTEGTRVNPENINYKSTTKGWLEGDDNDLFEVDPVGVVKTLRPLPADAYTFQYLERHPDLEPCDAPLSENARAYSTYFVDVAAPNGTDLEAFFDPVTVGTTVAADDTNGQLAPSSFGTTAISSISYESNEVTVTVDPVNGLSGRHLDFISLDGTLALSLEVSDAKKDNTDKTLTWPTTSDPWASGDTLMLRVYGATVDCSGTTTFGSCDQGPNFSASRFTFTVPENTAPGETIGTVLATDPDSSDIVTHSLLSGNEAGHFTIDDSTGVITLANRLDYETDTSHKLRVMARSGNWGLALATVTVDVTDVDPDLVPAPTNLVVTEVADGFDATWDAVPGATRYDIQWKIDPHQYTDVFTDTTSAEIRPDGGVLCNTLYKFRVYAHGDGVDYDAIWGEVPPPLYLRTAACAESPS